MGAARPFVVDLPRRVVNGRLTRSVAAAVAVAAAGSLAAFGASGSRAANSVSSPTASASVPEPRTPSEFRERAGMRIGEGLRAMAEAGAPLDRQRAYVAEQLRARKILARHAAAVVATSAPGITLRPTKAARASHLGGDALTIADALWPTNDLSGRPLSVLAVLDLAELRAPAPLPPDGSLVLYYDASGPDVDLTDAWMDAAASAEVRWIPPGTPTSTAPAPTKATTRFPRLVVEGTQMLIIGGSDFFGVPPRSRYLDRVIETLYGVMGEAYTHDQLLGASQDIQGPALQEIDYAFESSIDASLRKRYSAAEQLGKGWTLLAQIGGADTDEMMFADGGAVYFAIPTADLTQRRFDRTIAILQSH